MNRARKIETIIDSMSVWSYEDLLIWAQDTMELILEQLTDEDIDAEYEYICEDLMQ